MPEVRDEGVVGVEVGDELEAAFDRDDEALEVLKDDPGAFASANVR